MGYVFRNNEVYKSNDGASTFFDSADEVLILTTVVTDDEVTNASDLVKKCCEKLDNVTDSYNTIIDEHITDYQKLYRRTSLKLNSEYPDIQTDSLLAISISKNCIAPELLEKMFNLSRYLAICSGRPQPKGQPSKAPINLQGIWSQDRRPAWDCDYHLDLNLEMCYWPLDMINLGDLMNPLMDWAESMIPQGRMAAKDLYGCEGLYFPITCDYNAIGNVDNIGFYWTGGAAWVAQLLWQHWEYSNDRTFLQEHLFPFMVEIGEFYEDFLTENKEGFLVPSLSASPEMPIAGRKGQSFVSSPATIDLELTRDLFVHLIKAGKLLKAKRETIQEWNYILKKLPLPKINKDGSLSEWMEDHIPGDPGHRHRSKFVGLSPGDRISIESTPDYAKAAYNALKERQAHGTNMTQSLTFVWDAQILDRLYKGDEAFRQLMNMLPIHVLDNLLITCNDWGGKGGLAWFKDVRLFQIEANIGRSSSIIEMIFQDRQNILKFLPALPAELSSGKVKGLKARGGFEVGLKWNERKVYSATIRSFHGNPCIFKDNEFDRVRITCNGKEIKYDTNKDKGIISFDTEKDEEYQLTFYGNTTSADY